MHLLMYCLQIDGFAPIHTAACNNDVKEVKALIKHDEKLRDHPTALGETPIMLGCLHGCLDVVRCLHQNGASLQHMTSDRSTSLHYAAGGSANTLKYVLDEGEMKGYVNSTNKVMIECRLYTLYICIYSNEFSYT